MTYYLYLGELRVSHQFDRRCRARRKSCCYCTSTTVPCNRRGGRRHASLKHSMSVNFLSALGSMTDLPENFIIKPASRECFLIASNHDRASAGLCNTRASKLNTPSFF